MANDLTTGVRILYEQGPCFVVWKPSGVLTQAPPGIDSLESRLRDFLKAREGKSGNLYLGVPHRLDRPVSGAIVFARHVRAARRLHEQFEARTVHKRYWAVVEGQLSAPEGIWEDSLMKVPDEPRVVVVPAGHAEGKIARLGYRVLGASPRGTWLELVLETGRMHQIRVQAASRGYPVLGDSSYGAAAAFGPPVSDPRDRAIALHARTLAFRHPMTQEEVSVTAPTPDFWAELSLPLLSPE